jgi:hypothetical protein
VWLELTYAIPVFTVYTDARGIENEKAARLTFMKRAA